VLVNAGDDVWQYLNNEFQIKEAAADEAELKAREQGISGEALWETKEGKDSARGITTLDVMTRYYRLRNDSLDTVFIIPAYHEHPGTRVTRDIEAQPTVVSVVKPVWPERASVLEMKHRDDMKELKLLRQQNDLLQIEANNATESMKAVFMDQQLKAQELREFKSQGIQELTVAHAEIQRLNSLLTDPINQSQLKVNEESRAAAEAKSKALLAEEEFKKKTQALDQELKKAEEVTRTKEVLAEKEKSKLKYVEETMQGKLDQRKKALDAKDADIARAANITNAKLKAMWEGQIIEQQILIEFLKRTKSATLQVPQEPSNEDKEKGTAIAKKIIAATPTGAAKGATVIIPSGNDGQLNVPGGDRTRNNATRQDGNLTGARLEVKKALPAHSRSSSNIGIPSPVLSVGDDGTGVKTGKKKTKIVKMWRNRNTVVTWDLSDVDNVESVDVEVTDDEDEGEEGEKDKDVAME
jgi:hypothetical protein